MNENGGMERLINMPLEPATAESLQEIVESGRIIFEAGKRLVHGIQRLRGESGESGEWRIRAHPYLILGVSVGALVCIGVLMHRSSAGDGVQRRSFRG